jgi:hypothetical protein
MDPVFERLFGYGVLGALVVAIFIGWAELKPAIDERKAREKTKDDLIKELTSGFKQALDIIDAERKGRGT